MSRLSWIPITAVLIGLDRLTKWWAVTNLKLGQPYPLIGDRIRLTRLHNVGGAFGAFPGSGSVFTGVSIGVSAVLVGVLIFRRDLSLLLRVGISVVLAGALGNLIDRLLNGYVLDFFEIRGFPVFNLADSCVTIGAGLIIVYVLFGGDRHRPGRETDRA
jgi:signal peptidase II